MEPDCHWRGRWRVYCIEILLVGVATLAVLNASAAEAPKVELPDSMVGLWCYAKDISTDTEDHYLEPYGENGCDNEDEDQIEIWKHEKDHTSGYLAGWYLPGYHERCDFDKIEVINAETALVHASCWSGHGRDPLTGKEVKPPWTENLQLKVIGGELVITKLPEG